MRTHTRPLVIAAIAAIVGSSLVPIPASADGITVSKNSVIHSFAQQVTFSLEVSSDARISQIYPFFRVTDDNKTEKAEVPIEQPAGEVNVSYTHDAGTDLPSALADVSSWWQIEDTVGNGVETAQEHFKYTEDRFRWRILSEDGITTHWIEEKRSPAYAQTVLDAAKTSVEEITAELHAPEPESIDVYASDSEHHLEVAMRLGRRDWAGGQARPELGVVVIAVPKAQGCASRMKRYLPHEITHLFVYRLRTPKGYRHGPTWLDEGLATANEQLPTAEHALILQEPYEMEEFLPLEHLGGSFPSDPSTAASSYAQRAGVL